MLFFLRKNNLQSLIHTLTQKNKIKIKVFFPQHTFFHTYSYFPTFIIFLFNLFYSIYPFVSPLIFPQFSPPAIPRITLSISYQNPSFWLYSHPTCELYSPTILKIVYSYTTFNIMKLPLFWTPLILLI